MAELDDLRKRVVGEEFDYQVLLDVLRDYDRPRDKIRALLKKKAIIRVKKGLYVFGPALARRPYSRDVLANLIYGPSYISLDYALAYYGLIPEKVETVTSCTTGRARAFSTPVGRFRYRAIPLEVYPLGVNHVSLEDGRSFLIATPEKALADKLQETRGFLAASREDLQHYLVENLRITPQALRKLNPRLLLKIAKAYGSRKLKRLAECVR